MTATLHHLYPPASPVGHFLRLGHTGHRILGDLHAADRFPIERGVVDPVYVSDQSELLDLLHRSGVELVLDTKAAELKKIVKDAKRLRSVHLTLLKVHETSSNRTRALSPVRRVAEGRVITTLRKKK